MGRPYKVTCIRYYYGIFQRYKDDIFVRKISLQYPCVQPADSI